MPTAQNQTFVPIEQELRSHVGTACAAFHLNRKPQTLRLWACLENGPIRPLRVHGRLAWSVRQIKGLLEQEAK
jgi:hypothetical protein